MTPPALTPFFGGATTSCLDARLPYFSAFFCSAAKSTDPNPRPAARSERYSLAASHTLSADPITAPAAGTSFSL